MSVVTDITVVKDSDPIPHGFVAINYTADSRKFRYPLSFPFSDALSSKNAKLIGFRRESPAEKVHLYQNGAS